MSRATMSTAHETRAETPAETVVNLTAQPGRTLQIVCLSPQPWQIDLPTNRQQLMARIADTGHDVVYVHTGRFIGRQITAFVRRSLRLANGAQRAMYDPIDSRVRVLTALNLVPWGHRFRLAARMNAALTARMLSRRVRGSTSDRILWIYDPCFAACIGKVGERFAVYDCVDDYAEQTGQNARKRSLFVAYDELAASRSRLVFTTAQSLADRHRIRNEKTHLVRNVGDFRHFSPAADRSIADPSLASLASPVIGFAGNMHGQKVDFDLLEQIAIRRPEWGLALIGPAHEDTIDAVQRVDRLDNVRWVGPVSYADLPRYIAAMDVALIPYLSNAYTRSCFPLKTFEYLAAGKPVVASGVPELRGMGPHVVVADDPDAFIAAVELALLETSPADVRSRQELAAANTWETRTSRLLELVAAEL